MMCINFDNDGNDEKTMTLKVFDSVLTMNCFGNKLRKALIAQTQQKRQHF